MTEPLMQTNPTPSPPEFPTPANPQPEIEPGRQPETEVPDTPDNPTIVPDPQFPEITPGTPDTEVPPL